MAKTGAERQEKLRKERENLGFERFEIWVKPEWKAAIRDFLKCLK